jgi:large subunit ribosomal protein L2
MAVKVYKPVTPGQRASSVTDRSKLAKSPKKSLTSGRKNMAGRARGASISVRHKGGGVKKRLRAIDLRQTKDIPGVVETIEYDPYRTAFIALIKYADGDRRYVLAEERMKVGQEIRVGEKAPVKRGNRLPLGRIPGGADVFNIQYAPDSDSTFVRAAGSSASVAAHESKEAVQLKLPSGEVRRFRADCLATIGVAANREHENIRVGKAGRTRKMGIRPTVRGKAMNPVDHPHGGGEGGSPIGLPGPKSPSGLYTLGRKTRRGPRSTHVVRPRKGR